MNLAPLELMSLCVTPSFLWLLSQVRQLQEDAVRLQSAYAGDKADDIQKREGEVSCGVETRSSSGPGSVSFDFTQIEQELVM